MREYFSNELHHFVGQADPTNHERSYDILCKILKNGCVSHPPHNNDWGDTSYVIHSDKNLIDEGLVIPTVTCYCDIPTDCLAIHVSKYGPFGLSFRKEYLVQYGARPVIYVPLHRGHFGSPFGATLLRDIQTTILAGNALLKGETPSRRERIIGEPPTTVNDALRQINGIFTKEFLAFLKPFDAGLCVDDPVNYYTEREWRKFGNLKFKADDVTRIFLGSGFENRARADFPAMADRIVVCQA